MKPFRKNISFIVVLKIKDGRKLFSEFSDLEEAMNYSDEVSSYSDVVSSDIYKLKP